MQQQQQQPQDPSSYPKQEGGAIPTAFYTPYAPGPPGHPVVLPTTSIQRQQPQDFVVWSFFNSLFLNACCLGFVAFAFSIKSRDRKGVGDVESATNYGKTAKGLNIAALVLGILAWVIIIVMYVVMYVHVRRN